MYIDAGTGSMLFQAALAGFFAFLIFFRQIFSVVRILVKFSGKKDENSGSK